MFYKIKFRKLDYRRLSAAFRLIHGNIIRDRWRRCGFRRRRIIILLPYRWPANANSATTEIGAQGYCSIH